MRYLALAADYDGTLAHDGVVAPHVIEGLQRLAASGRKLLLVTGRELDELLGIFPEITLFDRVVAENGALLYRPRTNERHLLTAEPPQVFIDELRRRRVPLSLGSSIVATVRPHETAVLETIRDLGLELQVIFNKGAVMVLPASVNKATGLLEALKELGLSLHNVVAVGDGENDHAMLDAAEFSTAVANAVPFLQEKADFITQRTHGDGVLELIDGLLANDLADKIGRQRRFIVLGHDLKGGSIQVPPANFSMLIAGPSGSGKSTLTSGIIEELSDQKYQWCVIDPEGDHDDSHDAVIFGTSNRAPSADEIVAALEKPDVNLVINLTGVSERDRPAFFDSLLPRLKEVRAQTGRPHWIVVEEAHHLLPPERPATAARLFDDFTGIVYVTVSPASITATVLKSVSIAAALGDGAGATLTEFARHGGVSIPQSSAEVKDGEALLWLRGGDENPRAIRFRAAKADRAQHRRKYAEGELPPDRSFFFRGPESKLKLRAQNLLLFNQIADGVDADTWLYHLRQGDYSNWLRTSIHDQTLADEVAAIERREAPDAEETRRLIRSAIEQHYTLPASGHERA
jgi:hydroxymethylpyrimidine pyrophosphatase-like HAD family hydrolase/GTPase SAR1 family protein